MFEIFNKKENRDFDNFLDIGSVVVLKNGIKKVIIVGKNVSRGFEGEIKKFDFIGYPYPEGYLGDNYNIFFNKENVKKVVKICKKL